MEPLSRKRKGPTGSFRVFGEGRLIIADKIRNAQCSRSREDVISFTLGRAKKRRMCEERRDRGTVIFAGLNLGPASH